MILITQIWDAKTCPPQAKVDPNMTVGIIAIGGDDKSRLCLELSLVLRAYADYFFRVSKSEDAITRRADSLAGKEEA